MKRYLSYLIFALLILAFACSPALAYDYWANVYKITNATTQRSTSPITTGITFKVLTAGTNTAATLTKYNDRQETAVTNPVTAANFASATVCNGRVQFRNTAATVDLIVVDTAGGYTAVIKGFSPYDHEIIIDERPNIPHHGVIWFSGTTTDAVSTGVIFDRYTTISKVGVEVLTTSSGQTVNIGLSEDSTGYINKELLTNAGFITTSGASTGAYLGPGVAYQWYNQGHTLTSGTSTLYYGVSTSTGTPAGNIHYWFTRVR